MMRTEKGERKVSVSAVKERQKHCLLSSGLSLSTERPFTLCLLPNLRILRAWLTQNCMGLNITNDTETCSDQRSWGREAVQLGLLTVELGLRDGSSSACIEA